MIEVVGFLSGVEFHSNFIQVKYVLYCLTINAGAMKNPNILATFETKWCNLRGKMKVCMSFNQLQEKYSLTLSPK